MIPTTREIVYGIYGAWRLARLDRGAMAYFDQTVEGFWKSFFAAAIVAPGYVAMVLIDLGGEPIEAGFPRLFLVHVIAYVLVWTAFPVAAHHVCEVMGRQESYVRLIVALNWANVIQMVAYLPVMAIVGIGVLPPGPSDFLTYLVYVVLLAYQWFVIRTALGAGPGGAAALVALDVAIGFFINLTAFGMLR